MIFTALLNWLDDESIEKPGKPCTEIWRNIRSTIEAGDATFAKQSPYFDEDHNAKDYFGWLMEKAYEEVKNKPLDENGQINARLLAGNALHSAKKYQQSLVSAASAAAATGM